MSKIEQATLSFVLHPKILYRQVLNSFIKISLSSLHKGGPQSVYLKGKT